jgi:hypothetical protein
MFATPCPGASHVPVTLLGRLISPFFRCILGDPTIAAYYEYARQVEDLTAELTDAILGSRAGQALMTSGRLVMVRTQVRWGEGKLRPELSSP